MNKNIRRSLVIAAGVTGAWALGSAVASADDLSAHSVSVPDPAGDHGIVSGDGTVAGTVHRATAAVHHTTGTVRGAADAVHGDVSGVLGQAPKTGGAVHGALLGTTRSVQDTAAPAVGTADGTVARAGDAVHTAVPGAQNTVRHTGATVGDTVNETVVPTVGHTVNGAVPAAQGTVRQVAPMAEGAVRHAVPTVEGTVLPTVDGTVQSVLPTAEATVRTAVPTVEGTAQDALYGTGHTAQNTVDGTTGAAHDDVRATGHTARGVTAGVQAVADVALTEGGQQVAQVHATAEGEIDYLFGPLSSFAPQLVDVGQVVAHAERVVSGIDPALGDTVGDALGRLPGAGQRPVAPGMVQRTMAAPAADAAAPGGTWRGDVPSTVADAGLPARAAAVVGDAVPMGLQAVGDASYVGQGVLGHTQPLVDQVTGQGLDGVGQVVREVPGYAVGTAGTAAADTGRLAGHAVYGAQGVVGDVTGSGTAAF
ncbi:hypothetical protein [Streptomyces sp. TS71-3]|uniref:hypothetical protein n=1 Tax=Streptomyces sp. TS71-3 TaxID=2733862 RepID=UPI001B061664|nr:hypothetical protein [Streptomyces sp. TS71-3]GHJ35067.1 hypothetical protein Sm713_06760 [Streptomyces sp. TS71-3]